MRDEFVDRYALFEVIIVAAVFGILGARLFYIIGHWSYYSNNVNEIFRFWNTQGLVFYGGLLFGLLSTFLYMRYKSIPAMVFLDAGGVGIPVAMAITRIGCFLNGCCFGTETTMPWGVTYPVESGILGKRHPAQIYELILDLGVAAAVLIFRNKFKYRGEMLFLYVFLYGWVRFFMEFFREHQASSAAWGFQLGSIAIIVFSLGVFIFRRRLLIPA